MPKKEKFIPKVPPHHLYCPICGGKAIQNAVFCKMIEFKPEFSEANVEKFCDTCGARWVVRYYLKPKAITNIRVNYEYEDIPL